MRIWISAVYNWKLPVLCGVSEQILFQYMGRMENLLDRQYPGAAGNLPARTQVYETEISELESERENLIFENEHQLGTKPMEIDALVIKKKTDIPINKNIGRIFRKYNIIEYKSPTDYISINDFYKVCGYAFFYKADTVTEDEIPIEQITISLVSLSLIHI